MNEHDDAIDAVLSALRTAEPTSDFEARLQHALQTELAPRRTWRLHWGFAAAACLLLCGLVVGRGVHMRSAKRPAFVTKSLMPAAPVDEANAVQAIPVRKPALERRLAKPQRVAAALPTQEDIAARHQNIPPPPLPLTQEEKLVLRMMRHNDLPQLATLSGEARERGLRDDAQQYSAFFRPRPPLDDQPYFDQHISGGSQ